LVQLEGSGKREDGMAVLDADDPSRRKAGAVADAVDLVDDRHGRIARQHEIAMQRVHIAFFRHSPLGRDQSLSDHLSAEDPLPSDLRAQAAIKVVFELFEVKYV